MEPVRDSAVIARMKLAFDLYEAAEEIMRQNLRRTFPDAAREEIERRLAHWLQKRPGVVTDSALPDPV